MSIKFAHIAPTNYIELVKGGQIHLTLAHLVEFDQEYTQKYRDLAGGYEWGQKQGIMDNSAFEMYKRGLPMFPSEKLISLARNVLAEYIAMSDYPNEPWIKTVNAALEMAPQIRNAGFKTFFIPQSVIGDIDGLIQSCLWAASSPLVDYIGLSILAVPNAYGVEKDNKLQRFLSRLAFCDALKRAGFFDIIATTKKKIHFLGMVDGPNEITYVKEYHKYITSWDSSAAVWAGLNGIKFDNSPTGLINGKFEKEVKFSISNVSLDNVRIASDNISYINKLCAQGDAN